MALIITADSAIQNVPANTPVITAIGDVLVSDKFNRAGALLGSSTDSFLGGTTKAWSGTGQAANVTETTNGGRLNLASTSGTFSTCVDVGRSDFVITCKVSDATQTINGQNSMLEFCKAAADTGDTYRIAMGTYALSGATAQMNNMVLAKRVSGSAATLVTLPTYNQGETIKIEKKGNRIRIYFNDVLKADYTDSSPLTGTFCGFAGSSSNRLWRVSDYVIRSN